MDTSFTNQTENPLRGTNRLKLGLFAFNGTSGGALTLHPDRFKATWKNNVEIAQLADRIGLEALVPYAKWRGTGEHQTAGSTYETFAWAAGLAAVTKKIAVLSTVHVPIYHPLVVAKLSATIDHISNGRSGLNIVCGWLKPELDMFGNGLASHDDRYGAADEWLEVLQRLWTENEFFDYDGRYYSLKQAYSEPKPVGRPMLMNAGGSDRGRAFAAAHCDMAFIITFDPRPEAIKAQVEKYRQEAREKFGREIQMWTYAYCVQRDSIADAKKFVDEYAGTYGDQSAADEFISANLANAKTIPPEALVKMRHALMAGMGGYPLLGNADNITDELAKLSQTGLDGVLLTSFDFYGGLDLFGKTIIPRLEEKGLRQPFSL